MQGVEVMADDQIFMVSTFNHKRDTCPKVKQLTWQDISQMVATPVIREDKDGELFSPAIFEPAYRKKENVACLSLLEMDCDHCRDIERVITTLRNLGLCFLFHSTHSHKRATSNNPNAEPCYRIIIPLLESIPANLFDSLWQWGAMVTGNTMDEATKDSSRMFYLPSKHSLSAEYEYRIYEGELLDWRKLNLQPSDEKAPEAKKNHKKTRATAPSGDAVALTVDERELLELARKKFGAKFERLLSGNAVDYPDPKSGLPDDSRADNAFAVMLCDLGATDEQIERIWKTSERNRDKLYHHQTYIQLTIDSAREWIASHQEDDAETAPNEVDTDNLPISTNKKRNDYLKQVARNCSKLLDAVRLLFLFLGFAKNHNRILNALIRKGRDNFGVFIAKQEWLVEQYIKNGEKASSEKTISRDIHKLLAEQNSLGVEVLKYWPGYANWVTGEASASKFQNLFVRYALEAINEAIETSGDYEYSWQALEAACRNTASRIPRKVIPPTETETDKAESINARKEKLKAIRQTKKYLEILLTQGKEVEVVENEAQEIFFEALGQALSQSQNIRNPPSPEPDILSGSGNSETEVFSIR
jgi:hypothetical protein